MEWIDCRKVHDKVPLLWVEEVMRIMGLADNKVIYVRQYEEVESETGVWKTTTWRGADWMKNFSRRQLILFDAPDDSDSNDMHTVKNKTSICT